MFIKYRREWCSLFYCKPVSFQITCYMNVLWQNKMINQCFEIKQISYNLNFANEVCDTFKQSSFNRRLENNIKISKRHLDKISF